MVEDLEILEEVLTCCRTSFCPLVKKERWVVEQQWRGVYGRATFVKTGTWNDGGLAWNYFSSGHAKARDGAQASALYAAEHAEEFFVRPDAEDLPAFRCRGGRLPDFEPYELDIHVFPVDLAWTMAFTHEAYLGFGPYFARLEWQPASDPRRD